MNQLCAEEDWGSSRLRVGPFRLQTYCAEGRPIYTAPLGPQAELLSFSVMRMMDGFPSQLDPVTSLISSKCQEILMCKILFWGQHLPWPWATEDSISFCKVEHNLEEAQVGYAEFLLHIINSFTTHLASIPHTLSEGRHNGVCDDPFWFGGERSKTIFWMLWGDMAILRSFCSVIPVASWGYAQDATQDLVLLRMWSGTKPTALWTPRQVNRRHRAEDKNFHEVPHMVRLCLFACWHTPPLHSPVRWTQA